MARLAAQPGTVGREGRLPNGETVSAGDIIVTKRNDRSQTLGGTDFVRNNDRWLITEVGNRTVRFAPPDLVNIAVTAAGFGIYWMHPSAPLNLIHTLRWADIADSSIQRRRWGREDLTLVLRNGQRTIRFRLIRPSPVSPSMAGVLAAAVHHRTH